MSDGLEIISPTEQTVTIGGQAYTFGPVTMGSLKRFGEEATKVLEVIAELIDADEGDDLSHLVIDHADDLQRFAHVATGIDIKVLSKARPSEFVLVLLAAIRGNLDFFAPRLLPKAMQAAASQAQESNQAT